MNCLLRDRFKALSLFGPAWFISLTDNGIEFWFSKGACINLPGSCVCVYCHVAATCNVLGYVYTKAHCLCLILLVLLIIIGLYNFLVCKFKGTLNRSCQMNWYPHRMAFLVYVSTLLKYLIKSWGFLTVHLPHEINWNANLMQQGNFIVFLARPVSGTYVHHQEH